VVGGDPQTPAQPMVRIAMRLCRQPRTPGHDLFQFSKNPEPCPGRSKVGLWDSDCRKFVERLRCVLFGAWRSLASAPGLGPGGRRFEDSPNLASQDWSNNSDSPNLASQDWSNNSDSLNLASRDWSNTNLIDWGTISQRHIQLDLEFKVVEAVVVGDR